jgi:hypothetical protein
MPSSELMSFMPSSSPNTKQVVLRQSPTVDSLEMMKDYYLWTPEVKPVYPDLCLYILYIHH